MSVVTEQMVLQAHQAYMDSSGSHLNGMRAALAAVAPMIAAQEREAAIAAAAKALDAYGKWDGEITPERLMKPIAAAIRAMDAPAFVVATVEPDGSIRMRNEGDV